MILLQDKDLGPDSFEKLFCEKFAKLNFEPLDDESFEILIKLTTIYRSLNGGKFENSFDFEDSSKQKDIPFIIKLMYKRFTHCFDFIMFEPDRTFVFLFLSLGTETHADAVMFLTYIQYWLKQRNTKNLAFPVLFEIFAKGFPSLSDRNKLWDECKIQNGGNLLDNYNYSKSIMFEN
jgi:hypothetical protein